MALIFSFLSTLVYASESDNCRVNEIKVDGKCQSCDSLTKVDNCYRCRAENTTNAQAQQITQYVCDECDAKYGFNPQNKCVKCSDQIDHCTNCYSTDDGNGNISWNCQECEAPYYQQTPGTGNCLNCTIEHCEQCNWNSRLECSMCKTQGTDGAMYFDFDSSPTKCVTCGFEYSQNCTYDAAGPTITLTSCQEGTALAEKLKKCLKCNEGQPENKTEGVEGCLTCHSYVRFVGQNEYDTIQCETCDVYKGLFPFNSQATKNGAAGMAIEECRSCDDFVDNCAICKNINSQYYIEEYTQCVSCQFAEGQYKNSDGDKIDGGYTDSNYPFFCCSHKCASCVNTAANCDSCSSNRINAPECGCPPGFWEKEGEQKCTAIREGCSANAPASNAANSDEEYCCYNERCNSCPASDRTTCTQCKDSTNPFVGAAPNCKCQPGSMKYSYTENGQKKFSGGCIKCEEGTYTLEEDEEKCYECPNDKYECPGGMVLDLKEGYWRPNIYKTQKFQCINKAKNCKGGTGQGDQLCEKGYIGANCEACDLTNRTGYGNFANSGEYDCANCDGVSNNALKIVGIIFFQLLLMYFSVGGTITAIQDKIKLNSLKVLFDTHDPKPDEQGVLMKILNNYFYIIGVVSTFQLELPDGLKSLQGVASNPTKSMSYSFDCFLYDLQKEMPNIYFRIIWQILMAAAQIIIVLIIVSLFIVIKKSNISFRTFFFTTLIYQFIAIQPGLISMILEAMACRAFGDTSYILANVSMECYDQDYNIYTFTYLMPMLGVLAGAVPILLFLALFNIARISDDEQKKIISKNKIIPQIENQNRDQEYKQIMVKNTEEHQDIEEREIKNDIEKNQQTALNSAKPLQDSQQENSKPLLQSTLDKASLFFQTVKDKTIKQTQNDKKAQDEKLIPPTLDSAKSLQKYGYLYLEYRKDAYWWEFVKIYQRIVIASILSFYYADIKLKAILVFLTVFFYAILSTTFQPYKLASHNRIDILSTVITGVTLIIGLFLWDNNYSYWFIFGLFVMGLINIYFLIKIFSRIGAAKARGVIQKAGITKEIQLQKQEKSDLLKKIQQLKQQNEQLDKDLISLDPKSKEAQEIKQKLRQNQFQIKQYAESIQELDLVSVEQEEEQEAIQKTMQQQRSIETNHQDIRVSCTVKLINSIVDKFEQIGAKYFSQPTTETFKIVKIIKKQLKKHAKRFVYGIKSGQITITRLQIPGLPPSKYTAQQYLAGEMTPEQHDDLDTVIDEYKDCILNYNRILLQDIAYRTALKLKENHFDSAYWKSKIEEREQEEKQLQQEIQEQENNNKDGFTQNHLKDDDNEQDKQLKNNSNFNSKPQSPTSSIKHQNTSLQNLPKLDHNNSSQPKIETQQSIQLGPVPLRKSRNSREKTIVSLQQKKSILNAETKMSVSNFDDMLRQIAPQNERKSRSVLPSINEIHDNDLNQNNNPEQSSKFEIVTLNPEQIFSTISTKELFENLASFQLFDPDGSGIITKDEFRIIMRQLGQNLSSKDLNYMISQVDSDGNGEVDFCEFLSLMALQKYQFRPENEMREIFHWYDAEADGFLDWEETQHMIKVLLGTEYDKKIIQEIIDQEDQDGDGKLSYREFVRIIL